MILDDTTLEETIVPVLVKDEIEMAITIDYTLLDFFKIFTVVRFDDTYAHFGDISYRYRKGDVLTWGTRLPERIAVMNPPKLLPNGHSSIKVNENKLIFGDTIEECIFYKLKNFDGVVEVNMDLIKKVFEKHMNESYIICLEDNFPIGIEFLGSLTVRYYVAPLEI
jgi:hypothetical protein